MDGASISTPCSKDLTESALAGLPRSATGPSLLGTKTGNLLHHKGLCSRDQSPAPSTSTVPNIHHTLPRRATSTGAAFMQRHIQLHSPEASDTEHTSSAGHPDPAPRRKPRSRILSGDWAPSLRSFGSGSSSKARSRPVSLQGRIPSLRLAGRDHPASPLSPAGHPDQATIAVPGRPDRERRVQSAAFYPTRPVLDDSDGVENGEVGGAGTEHNYAFGALGSSGELQEHHDTQTRRVEGDARKGVAGRLRSFGNWFRRLGTH